MVITGIGQSLCMTVDQFIAWGDGTDTRYELIDGRVVARAPVANRHGSIIGNLSGEIDRRLEARSPCHPVVMAGIQPDDRNYLIADIAATCAAPSASVPVIEPFLVVEVVSPSSLAIKLATKVQTYIKLPSVLEIWLIDSTKRWFQLWRRGGPDSWIVGLPLAGDASFDSPTLADRVSLDRLYRNTGL